MKTIVVKGLGLMGGSLAKDLRRLFPESAFIGMDANPTNAARAVELDLVDRLGEKEDLATADMVILCIPVNALTEALVEVMDSVGDQCLVWDTGSTKAQLCKAVAQHPRRHQYVAAHPIAGTENTGPEAAIFGLFEGKTNIVCEVERSGFDFQERARKIYEALGMRIRFMNPDSHDRHIAFVSHLSHISSFMLGKTVMEEEQSERDIFDMAGSGFESTVRLAKSSPAMWTPIFEQNSQAVLEALGDYINHLTDFKCKMEEGRWEELFEDMQQINGIRSILEDIPGTPSSQKEIEKQEHEK